MILRRLHARFCPQSSILGPVAIAVLIAICLPEPTLGTPLPKGTLVKTFDFAAVQFELDAANHRLYATVPSANGVAIIDTQSLSLMGIVFVGSNPFGLGLSEDGSRLYIGNRGSTVSAVTAFDTQTMSVVGNFELPVSPIDIAVGKNHIVYASPPSSIPRHGIMVLDGLTGTSLGEFAAAPSLTAGLLEIAPDRTSLFWQQLGYSPSDAYKYELTGTTGSFDWGIQTGSNGQDLAVSHNGQFFAAPNGSPYNIRLFRASDGAVLGTLNTGAYPREIAFSPDDLYAYAVHTSGEIDVFRTDTFLPDGPISVSGKATELIVDETGRYVFASFESEVRVYATGIVPEPSTAVIAAFGFFALLAVCLGRRRKPRDCGATM